MTDKKIEKLADKFIQELKILTAELTDNNINPSFLSNINSLKKQFEKFAIVDEFNSFKIVDVYNEIRISRMQLTHLENKTTSDFMEFSKILDSMFAVIEDLYFYEIFGFYSTLLWPDDIPEAKLPCKIHFGCVEGWQKEPYLKEDGTVAYENVVRFENGNSKELLCMTISEKPRILEGREKCVFTDEEIEIIQKFIKTNIGIIHLHNCTLIDSSEFHAALKVKLDPIKNPPTYRIKYSYSESFGLPVELPVTKYVDMNDMPYEEALKFFEKIKGEMSEDLNSSKDDFDLIDFEIIRPEDDKHGCCFCNNTFDGMGNSTWPIYYKGDGESHRCCDECNIKYVKAARSDRKLIMSFRKKFGIDYTEYTKQEKD